MKLLELTQEDGTNLVVFKVANDSLKGAHQACIRTDEQGYVVMVTESFVASLLFVSDYMPSEELWTMLGLWALDYALRCS